MQINQAKASQLQELAAFARSTYEQAFGDEIGLKELQQHLNENMSDQRFRQMLSSDTFYLARNNSLLTGFAQVGSVDLEYEEHLQEFDPKGSELRRLYVLADSHSRGIGSALIERAMQDPFVASTSSVYLTTWESNHGAQKLYRKHNFEKVGEIPEYRSDGHLNGYEHVMVRTN